MKRMLGNIWLQLFFGFIAVVVVVIAAFWLAVLMYIKFAGFALLFGMGSNGDGSPITFLVAAIFLILALAFPVLVWFLLDRFGNLKSASKNIRTASLILFATLTLSLSFGWEAFSKKQSAKNAADENYRLV